MKELILISHVVNPSLSEGFLPAARKLGLRIVVLTDCAEQQRHHFSQQELSAYPDEIISCDVFNPVAVIEAISLREDDPVAIFSNSDHLQTSTAIAANYFALPGKDWRVTYRAKNKAEMRTYMKAQQIDQLWHASVWDPASLAKVASEVPYPCVIKPREGVASEQVFLAEQSRDLEAYCDAAWNNRPGQVLLIEPYLEGELYTLETLGDGKKLQVLGGFRVSLSSPPSFVELQAHWGTDLSVAQQDEVLKQISDFGIGFGACHTEFVLTAEGPRLIEINYRSIGDRRDFLMQDALDIDYFETVLHLHMGEPLEILPESSRAAAIHYFTPSREGLIVNAPEAFHCDEANMSLSYQPLRKSGDQLALSHSNRDYLGVMSGTGPDATLLGDLMARHSAALNWEIR